MDYDEQGLQCRKCKRFFPSSRALGGHIGHCKARLTLLDLIQADRAKRARLREEQPEHADLVPPPHPHLPAVNHLDHPPIQNDDYDYGGADAWDDRPPEPPDEMERPSVPGLPTLIGELDLSLDPITLPPYAAPTHGNKALDKVAEFIEQYVDTEVGVDELFKLQHDFAEFFTKYPSARVFKSERDAIARDFVGFQKSTVGFGSATLASYHRPILDLIQSSFAQMKEGYRLIPEVVRDADGERIYDDVFSSDALISLGRELDASWRRQGAVENDRPVIVPILMVVDKSNVATSGDRQVRPVVAMLLNRSAADRRSKEGCATVGFVPVTSEGDGGLTGEKYKRERRKVIPAVISDMLRPVTRALRCGLRLTAPDGKVVRGYPVVLITPNDLMEAGDICGHRVSAVGSMPCLHCDIDGASFLDLGKCSAALPKTWDVVQPRIERINALPPGAQQEKLAKSLSLWGSLPILAELCEGTAFHVDPFFGYNIDTLHQIALGTDRTLLEATSIALANALGRDVADLVFANLQEEYSSAPRTVALRVPRMGLDAPKMTGQETSALFDLLPVGLYSALRRTYASRPRDRHTFSDFVAPVQPFLDVLSKYHELRLLLRLTAPKERDLLRIRELAEIIVKGLDTLTPPRELRRRAGDEPESGEDDEEEEAGDAVEDKPVYLLQGAKRIRALKTHLLLHFSDMIRRFGPLPPLSNAPVEAHHKEAKESYAQASKADDKYMSSMVRILERSIAAGTLQVDRGVPDPTKPQTDRGYLDRARLGSAHTLGAGKVRVSYSTLKSPVFKHLELEIRRTHSAVHLPRTGQQCAVAPMMMISPRDDSYLMHVPGGMIYTTPLVGLVLEPGVVYPARADTDVETGALTCNTFVSVEAPGGQTAVAQLILAYSVKGEKGELTDYVYVRYLRDAPRPPGSDSVPAQYYGFMTANERFFYGTGGATSETVRYEVVPLSAIEGPVYLMRDSSVTPVGWMHAPQTSAALKKLRFWRMQSVKGHT